MSKLTTKLIIAKSLEDLLKYQSINDITIDKIVNNVGLTRTTFYRHFIDKNDLVQWTYKYYVDRFIKLNNGINCWQTLTESVCNYIYMKKDFIYAIYQYYGQNSFYNFLYNYSIEYLTQIIQNDNIEITEQLTKSIEFYVTGTIHIDYQWISHNFRESPQMIASIICENVPLPLVSILLK